jgi:divalent metal cation (Fe/Co/Zn/Cd) transporter
MAIAASTLDSLLDLMAGGILYFTHIYMKKSNIYKYPIGKLRVQPVGIIIFAAIMATLGNVCLFILSKSNFWGNRTVLLGALLVFLQKSVIIVSPSNFQVSKFLSVQLNSWYQMSSRRK